MLLVVTYAREARRDLRNVCRRHEDTVVRHFGRAALLEATGHGAFLALCLRERHGLAVQVERTEPFNEFEACEADCREAAAAYEAREARATPYGKFAAGRDLPSPAALKEREL